MAVIRHTARVARDRALAFDYVNAHETVPDWMFGITRFDPVTEQTVGLGATFAATMKIGPKSLNSTLRVTEYVESEVVRLDSVDGLDVSTTWRFSDVDGGTEADVEFAYSLPGGFAGRALAAIIEPVVGQAIRHTESKLTAQVESLD